MKRFAAFFLFHLLIASLPAASPLLVLDNVQLPSPASVGAHAPQFVSTANGYVLLSWIQPGPEDSPTLHFSAFDAQTRSWREPAIAGSTSPRSVSTLTVGGPGPITIAKEGRVASVWFVDDKRDPRILLSLSPDAGAHFLMPLHVEDTRPIGAPDLVLLADGTVFVSWLERGDNDEIAIWLRRISPGGELSVPSLIATLPAGTRTFPRLALLKDYDTSPAQLLIAYGLGEGDTSQIVTRVVTIPLPKANSAKPCNCPDEEAARGYALKGRVLSSNAARATLTVQHDEISGVLSAAITEFKTDPATLKFAAAGNEVFARIEKRDNQWFLFGARLVLRP